MNNGVSKSGQTAPFYQRFRVIMILLVIFNVGTLAIPVVPSVQGQFQSTLAITDLDSQTPEDLVKTILGSSITVSNIQYSGTNGSAGTFTGGDEIIGFQRGIILSSGSVRNVIGPNRSDEATAQNGRPGDGQLNTLIPGLRTLDATVLEFDFVPSSNIISFQYVFSSDEYNEFVGSSYNDVFGFFVNGTNIALLPGTSTPVAINNVNGGRLLGNSPTNPEFYRNNDLSDGGGAINTEMDGLTVTLTAQASVNPNQVNHIKLAIADATDDILDSNVFIKAGSFVDEPAPCTIACPGNFVVPSEAGKRSAVVDYALPDPKFSCPGAKVICLPPSGVPFPVGTTEVTCTGTGGNNTARCSFTVTVNEANDSQAPLVTCPSNIVATAAPNQSAAEVNYPMPLATDNFPGVRITCNPPSGSSFPVGVATTVNCTATDASNNTSSCSFTVAVNPAVQPAATFDVTSLDFGRPVTLPNSNRRSETFGITNPGFIPIEITLESIIRIGPEADRLADKDDSRLFSVRIINADETETEVGPGTRITIQPRQTVRLRTLFTPSIPSFAENDPPRAREVLPDVVTSQILFRQSSGQTFTVTLVGRVSTALKLLDGVSFTGKGSEFLLTYSIFDPNLDLSRAKYELLREDGQVIKSFEVDLAAPLGQANIIRGQSFIVEQKFTGVKKSSKVKRIRLVVTDGDGTADVEVPLGGPTNTAQSQPIRQHITLVLPDLGTSRSSP